MEIDFSTFVKDSLSLGFSRGESPINITFFSIVIPTGAQVDHLTSLHFAKVYYIVLNFKSKEDCLKATKGGKTLVARCKASENKVEELDELLHDIEDTTVEGVKGPTNGNDDDDSKHKAN